MRTLGRVLFVVLAVAALAAFLAVAAFFLVLMDGLQGTRP